ncbi:MAG: Na+/H+ antiporter NhaC family protein [Clostridia bacterium]|jgi:NhaC family Na+:H+ antiporter
MEIITLSIFCITLIICISINISIIYALLGGVLIFCFYGRAKNIPWMRLANMAVLGIKTVKNILIVFVLIGIMTALWRACGTIPVIISYAVRFVRPDTLVLTTFLLNCGISMLTGTSVGTAATMGVICMTMAVSMGINPVIAGGAILSGVYFGDRCSPVSTSALLVSELTDTNLFDNIKKMFRTALFPFLLTCAIYMVVGFSFIGSGATMDLQSLFSRVMRLHWIALMPALIILILSLLGINVKVTMSASIIVAALICLFIQDLDPSQVLHFTIAGYSTTDAEVGALLNGGGIQSMLRVMAIVCISSSYAGIFQNTEILHPVKRLITGLSEKITPYGGILVTSVITAMIACNQTLTIMMTYQLCNEIETDSQKLAIHLENTAVVIAPLIPWSIAGAVPLASIGAPTSSILMACFLYILPIYTFIKSCYHKPLKSKS